MAGLALDVVLGINATYVTVKGRTFYANHFLVEQPLASDPFINETLEILRQFADWAIARRDERQIEQSMRAFAALVQVYLEIDYASLRAEKMHAHLAAGYLGNTVQKVIPHDMADVLMEGQRALGLSAQRFVVAESATNAAGISDKIAVISRPRPVSRIATVPSRWRA